MPLDNFRTIDRETAYLLPPSVDEWQPERHLARFIVEVIDRLDLSAISRSYRGTGKAGDIAGGQRLLQRRQCGAVRCGTDRSDDCAGPPVASSVLGGALCQSTAGAGEPDAARGHEPSSADARRQEALRLAQADSGTGVRHHQIGDGLPSVPPAWP